MLRPPLSRSDAWSLVWLLTYIVLFVGLTLMLATSPSRTLTAAVALMPRKSALISTSPVPTEVTNPAAFTKAMVVSDELHATLGDSRFEPEARVADAENLRESPSKALTASG